MTPSEHREAKELFGKVLELEPHLRVTILDAACAGRPQLRREVESLLMAYQKAGVFIDAPVVNQGLSPEGIGTAERMVGSTLEAYRIDAVIGEGGMGVVYRALDSKLNRPVAIKFLSGDVADPAARRRFQREAQMASSLNHPHILIVHDAGEFEGRQYLVTEFVDGGTLKDWAHAEKRTWRQIVELLVGVADGLAAAHGVGITHRDIKPANILVARNGYAKLADFGLAKLSENVAPEGVTRTLTEPTRPGVIVGTIAYMSPEQASGRPVDARSDIFSFGVVLYELLAGQRPFTGNSDQELLQNVIHGAARTLPDDLPYALRIVVEKALEKDPAERYQSMRDLVVDLRRISRQSAEIPMALPPQRARRLKWAAAAALIVLAIAAGSGLIVFRAQRPAAPGHLEYTQLTDFADAAVSPALSPDGRMLTFIRGEKTTLGGRGDIYIKLLPDGEPTRLTHDGKSKMSPVFHPNGARIAYTVVGNVPDWDTWTVPALGGAPNRLLPNASGLTWAGTAAGHPRVMFSEWGKGVHMSIITSAENRSEARTVYAPASLDTMAHLSYLSPDGKEALVVEMLGGWGPCRLAPFEGSAPARLVGPSSGQCSTAGWSPDGTWMYFSVNTGNGYHIWRQRFPSGAPEQVTFGASEEEGISFAPDGRSFVTSAGTRQSTLWAHDARGEREISSHGYASLPLFSADAKKLYYLLRSRANRRYVSGELWAANLETGQIERLLPDFLLEHYSVSADGSRIVFAAIDDTGRPSVWLARLDGRAAPRRLSTIRASRTFFGANGDVFFLGQGEETTEFIFRVREDGSGLQRAIPNPVNYFYDVSPDGEFLAVWAERTVQVYSAHGGSPTPVSTVCTAAGGEDRGIMPPCVSWSPDGKFFHLNIRDAGQICAVPLQPGRSLPPLPVAGIRSLEEAAALPGARLIRQPYAFIGANPSVYAFFRVTTQRNIYRVSVP